MSKFTKEKIDEYANKVLIGLSDEENKTISDEFDVIDQNINMINEIDGLDTIEPAFFPYDLYTATLREDIPKESAPIEEILRNTLIKEEREVRVTRVVGE